MFSRPSNRGAALLGLAFLSGCAVGPTSVPTAPSSLAFVNLDVLAARDSREVAPVAPGLSPVAPVGRDRWANSLDSLPATPSDSNAKARRVREARELWTSSARELGVHLAVLGERQQQVVVQRRAELLASEREAQIGEEQAEIDASSAKTRRAIEERAGALADLQRARTLYAAQLKAGILGSEPSADELNRLRARVSDEVRDLEGLREAVAALRGGGTADFRPAPRARMTAMSLVAELGRRRVSTELDQIWADGEEERLATQRAFRQKLAERVDAKLASMRRPEAAESLADEARWEVDRTLKVEARTADSSRGAPRRDIRVTVVTGNAVAAPKVRPGDLRATLRREELIALVRDAAERRHLVVAFEPKRGVPDRTEEFAAWIGVRKGKT